MKERGYVDDIVRSGSSPAEVTEIQDYNHCYTDTILNQGKFSVKAWHSNYPEVDQAPNENHVYLLGHRWDMKKGSLTIATQLRTHFVYVRNWAAYD